MAYIFVIENLPNHPEDDIPGSYPVLPVQPQNYASVYGPVLKQVFSSPLFRTGKISDVYVNFPANGWFKIDLKAAEFWVNVTEKELDDVLPSMLYCTDVETWSRVPDMVQVMASFPAGTRVIGCLAGEEAVCLRALSDYISVSMSDYETYAFVTRLCIGEELDELIEEYVAVSSGPWTPSVYEVCDLLFRRTINRTD